MKGLYFDGKLKFSDDLPKPAPEKGEALVKVVKSGICRTDIEIAAGYMGFNGIPGHEFVGIIEDAPDKNRIGDRVVGEINCGCNDCAECRQDSQNHCRNRTVLGIHKRNGAFAEYLTLPEANLHHVPESVTDEEALFAEPLAAAFRVIEQVNVLAGEVLVLGDGKLGILIAQVIGFLKGNVTLCGKHPEKLKLVEDRNVAPILVDDLEKGKLYPVVVDATGNRDGLSLALSHTKAKGTIIVKTTVAGNSKPAEPADFNRVVIDEITVKGSRCGPFEHALTLLGEKAIPVTRLIQETLPLEKGVEAFETASKPGALKVVFG
jgi:threonine dehydrogenase-like Zn-dependent dehydrogenase